ncbi:MAG: hypothetical protein DBX47_07495 [Clostridiales bacterium]|nr:MAG: hypothetical protein DBX47_07495 [Clostridiales bacterium]
MIHSFIKKKSFLIAICVFVCLLTASCNTSSDFYDYAVVFNGNEYIECSSPWYPIGEKKSEKYPAWAGFLDDPNSNRKDNTSVWLIDGDEDNSFLILKNIFSEEKLYCRKNTVFPDYINDEVEKIVFSDSDNNLEYTLSDAEKEAIISLLKNCRNETLPSNLLSKRQRGPGVGFLHIYYKEFSVYCSDIMIDKTIDNKYGLAFSETQKNNDYLGSYENVIIIEKPLNIGAKQ